MPHASAAFSKPTIHAAKSRQTLLRFLASESICDMGNHAVSKQLLA
jgi:hypothetical protein